MYAVLTVALLMMISSHGAHGAPLAEGELEDTPKSNAITWKQLQVSHRAFQESQVNAPPDTERKDDINIDQQRIDLMNAYYIGSKKGENLWSPILPATPPLIEKHKSVILAFCWGLLIGFILSWVVFRITNNKSKIAVVPKINYENKEKEIEKETINDVDATNNGVAESSSSSNEIKYISKRCDNKCDAISRVSVSSNSSEKSINTKAEQEINNTITSLKRSASDSKLQITCRTADRLLQENPTAIALKKIHDIFDNSQHLNSPIITAQHMIMLTNSLDTLSHTIAKATFMISTIMHGAQSIQKSINVMTSATLWMANRQAKKDAWSQVTDSVSISCFVMHVSMYLCSFAFGRWTRILKCKAHFNILNPSEMLKFGSCILLEPVIFLIGAYVLYWINQKILNSDMLKRKKLLSSPLSIILMYSIGFGHCLIIHLLGGDYKIFSILWTLYSAMICWHLAFSNKAVKTSPYGPSAADTPNSILSSAPIKLLLDFTFLFVMSCLLPLLAGSLPFWKVGLSAFLYEKLSR